MSWLNRKKPFLPPPPEGFKWHAEDGSGYRFRLKLVPTTGGWDGFTRYSGYADYEWTLPWAARRILKQYRKDQGGASSAVVNRVNETDWAEQ